MSSHLSSLLKKAEDFGFTAFLLLEDGNIFFGYAAGAGLLSVGELCFTTAATGYQHTITDPSFAEQIITFTTPHIGNVGINNLDQESCKIFCKGLIFRECAVESSHHQKVHHFNDWLKSNKIPVIYGIDTRALTKIIRSHPQNAVICTKNFNLEESLNLLESHPKMQNMELATKVSGFAKISGQEACQKEAVSVIDFGVKSGIIKNLQRHFLVNVIKAEKNFDKKVFDSNSVGVVFSNGPGDPSATYELFKDEILNILREKTPILGICLGCQLLALALNLKTKKMEVGHRGSNHPVYNKITDKVEITSQNHGFAVINENIPNDIEVTHTSLFDGSIEGFKAADNIFAYQHHPEGSPGPTDSSYIFKEFFDVVNNKRY